MPGGSEPSPPTRATVWIEGSPVTILPKRAPVGNSGPIRGRTLAVFATPDRAALDRANTRRVSEPFRATIEPGARPGFALLDLTEAEATAIRAALGLPVLLFWDGRRAEILGCRQG